MTQQVYSVAGMTCANCVRHVSQAFEDLPGVEKAEVDLDRARATVTWSSKPPLQSTITSALEEAGYEVKLVPELPKPPGSSSVPW